LIARRTLGLHQTVRTKQAGAAPRHAVFHPYGETLYVVNEGSGSEGHLAELTTYAAVPAGRERGNAMGDIKIDREGRFLYCSNRGHESIAVFAVSDEGRVLERIETTPCRGEHPRGLCLSPDGRFLLVANQGPTWRIDRDADSGSPDAGVVVFAVDSDSGSLAYTGQSLQIDSATCIAFNK
jgi:6-phosphogluconolactonase